MSLFTPEFISMLVGIIVALLIAVVPQFEAVKTELIAVVTILVGLVVSGLGLERVAAARSSGLTHAERLSSSTVRYSTPPSVKTP